MRKIAATYIFPLTQAPIKYGILVCENDGRIVDLIDNGEQLIEKAGVEFYSGILVPGFVLPKCNLQNHNKVSNRKMWAEGIAVAADIENSTYVVPERTGCKIQKLNTSILVLNEEAYEENAVLNQPFLETIVKHQENNKHLKLDELLKWGSLNSAKMFGFDSMFGSFDVGKVPGVNVISAVDFQEMKLTSKSKVKRLI